MFGALTFIRFLGKLSAVPYSHNPDCFFFYAVEKPVWSDNDFPEEKVRKLR